MKTASGLAIVDNACSNNRLLLIQKDGENGKWGFTGGLVPDELLNCHDFQLYDRLLGSAISLHCVNTGLNPNRIAPVPLRKEKDNAEDLLILDYVESEKVRLVHFSYRINCSTKTYFSELVLSNPKYNLSQIKFFSFEDILEMHRANQLLPNVIKVVETPQEINQTFI